MTGLEIHWPFYRERERDSVAGLFSQCSLKDIHWKRLMLKVWSFGDRTLYLLTLKRQATQ